jgi:hypothetical protein
MPSDAATWRSIREDLEGLPLADWNKNWSLLPPVVDGKQLHSQWVWFDPTDPSLCARADAILRKAATARGYISEDQWTDELRFADFVRFKSTGDTPAELADGTTVAVPCGLLEVVSHSITLCHQVEAGDVPKPIITRLPREAAARLDESMAAFWRRFSLKLRQAPELKAEQRRRIQQATFLCKLVTKTFEMVAREYMQVCSSVNEFEVELRSGLARHIEVSVGLHIHPGNPMLIELNKGLNFFRAKKTPWAAIPQTKRRSRWHASALTAEALAHTARRMTAEATARIAGRGQPGAVAVSRPPFPNRAAWLKARLAEREWNEHNLQAAGGPEHRTTLKILKGLHVQDGVLRKVILGLQSKMTHKRHALPEVQDSDIPNN